MHFFTPTPLE